MNNVEMRDRIQIYISQLSPERLSVALDFLAYLVERESEEATRELLSLPNLKADLGEAEQDIESGALTDWQSIRNDV